MKHQNETVRLAEQDSPISKKNLKFGGIQAELQAHVDVIVAKSTVYVVSRQRVFYELLVIASHE